jgi:hypothetical protein
MAPTMAVGLTEANKPRFERASLGNRVRAEGGQCSEYRDVGDMGTCSNAGRSSDLNILAF